MNILITGSSGLIGAALTSTLTADGHTVYPLLRKKSPGEPFYWLPAENIIQLDESVTLDAVINLAGENIADSRWSNEKKKRILSSREDGTRLLSNALANLKNKPAVLISSSAIGFYGDTGQDSVDESSHCGSDFLAEVAQRWEQATQPAEEAGIRTVHIRTGIVLSPDGGVLQKLITPFRMGLGGVIGNGQQYMSWISINDVINIIKYLLEKDSFTGPVNLVSNAVSNYTFTKTLGTVLNRPTLLPLPARAAQMMFGEMADALLLSSTRVKPQRLEESGYRFFDDDLEKTLRSLLKK